MDDRSYPTTFDVINLVIHVGIKPGMQYNRAPANSGATTNGYQKYSAVASVVLDQATTSNTLRTNNEDDMAMMMNVPYVSPVVREGALLKGSKDQGGYLRRNMHKRELNIHFRSRRMSKIV